MPRKAFVSDLQDAIKQFEKINVSDLKAGDEDGTITFDYHMPNGDTTAITVLVPDLGEYPGSHMYMIYTNSQHVPKAVHESLDGMDSFVGVKVPHMLSSVVKHLNKATAGSQENPVDLEDGDDPMVIDSDQESEVVDDSDHGFGSDDDNDWSQKSTHRGGTTSMRSSYTDTASILALNDRIRSDLRLAKEAGFRIACLGTLLGAERDGILCLSIHVSRLGISNEALQAWHMDAAQYFILLIRYTDGYIPFDRLNGSDMAHASQSVRFRVGLHRKYKVSLQEALDAFVELAKPEKKKNSSASSNQSNKSQGLDRLFIGRPLDELLNLRLLPLLRYRTGMGLGWRGAEEFFNDHQGRNLDSNTVDSKYWIEDRADQSDAFPGLVTADHLSCSTKDKSFPLVAMQFTLRHLVRCTEFCLVCHCKIDVDFEALKPYVCSKPLCLYQYMNLGFGPSIEHEIISQPHVVDLLVSFCYSSAYAGKLRYLPTGMALMVPGPSSMPSVDPTNVSTAKNFTFPSVTKVNSSPMTHTNAQFHKAKFDPVRRELIFPPGEIPALQIGSWIKYRPHSGDHNENYHAKVVEILLPIIRLSNPIPNPRHKVTSKPTVTGVSVSERKMSRGDTANPAWKSTSISTPSDSIVQTNSSQIIEYCIYEENFDDFTDYEKQMTICTLLDTLPSIKDMKNFLLEKSGQLTPLHTWSDRISPAALGILRWIIASNRSCILQVDSLDGSYSNSADRVQGMPGWMQFRFAQGAPDKEQRFISSVQKNTIEARYPTLFAWHGSPLHNWHGIVREGLHFEHKSHGRAYGDGVYHALDVSTSLGYSGLHASRISLDSESQIPTFGHWAHSHLKITQAVVLNEIVNAPAKFVSRSPHLVVSEIDWIQSRYLFVMCGQDSKGYKLLDAEPPQIYEQDPEYHPVGQLGKRIFIPVTAVSKSRRQSNPSSLKSGNKKQRIGDLETPPEEVILSDDTDIEDNMIFFPTEEEERVRRSTMSGSKDKGKAPELAPVLEVSKTDFIPRTHDIKSLPLIDPPSYATSSATRTLQRELKATLKTQDSQPLHELGWFIDSEIITTVYQWIVELHSFESHLPLAKDLKSKELKSVVLEIRFGKDYPMTPPFVRVIRPRFLSFMEGGGGHVTAGGALCMELLTNSGWSAVSNIESVLLQVRLAMSSTDPRPAKLAQGSIRDYTVGEAVDAFVRACNMHGWEIPPDFRSSYSQSSSRF